jgi:hypothetical protein
MIHESLLGLYKKTRTRGSARARANLTRAILAQSLNESSLSWGWLGSWFDSARIIIYIFFLPNTNLIIHLTNSLSTIKKINILDSHLLKKKDDSVFFLKEKIINTCIITEIGNSFGSLFGI